MSGNIKVVCRFRPQNRVENENNGQIVVSFPDEQNVVIEHSKGKNNFAFDRIYDWTASQREVFMYSAKQVVDDVMNGYNGTIFAYGQTGSGKTFTMQGPDIDNPELRGLIPRIVEYIFTSIVNAPSTMEFTVSISYLEIYMEKIRDLLDRRNDNLQIHEEKIKGVYVKGATSVYVSSPEETMQVMKIGTDNRAVSATNMNEESSRSHSVMLLSINQKNVKDGSSKSGKLYLVDLAGSEMVGKTGATGQTLEEAKKINKSLTALGMVINALTDGKSTHVPYRDSKLTRLLQESLGGNSRTTLVINCSPSSYNDAETLSTLRFGMRAKKIENKAKVNQELSSAELRKLLDIARKQFQNLNKVVAAMEKELTIWRTGGKVAETEWVNASQIMEGEKHEREEATPEKPAAATAPAPEKVSSSLEKAAASEKGDDGSSTATELSRSTSISSGMDQEDQEEVEVPEGDLIDQIVQKELQLKTQEDMIDKLQNELERYRGEEINAERFIKENKELNQKLNEATFKFEKQSHEYRELEFGNETLQQTNQSLQEKLTAAEKRVEELELQVKQSETDVRSEKIKAKMAEEMASVNIYTDQINMRENEVRANLVKLNSMDGVPPPSPRESVASTRKFEFRISELEELVENLKQENISLVLKQHGLTSKVKTLEEEYENILDEMIAKEEERQYEGAVAADNLHELKIKLEAQFEAKKEAHIKQLEELRIELSKRNDDLEKLRNVVTDQKWSIEHLQTENDTLKSFAAEQETKAKSLMATSQTADEKDKEVEELKKMMNRQLEDFNKMKEHLLKDLQNRCQKVVELEISLDQSRDQYQSVLRSSNNKNQQKKMAVLEKSLEQVSAVHTQLVEQNAQLKREAAMSVRKLEARAERIHNLEILLQDSQERLERQAQKYETEIHALQEKLTFLNKEPKKSVDMSRIAKPIRGGAAIPASPSAQYAFSSVMPSSTASPSHLQKSRSENLSSTSSPSGKPNMFGLLWTTPKKS